MYQKITQEAEGQLFGRRFTWDKYEGAEMDFDVLNDYTVYAHATASYIAEYIPTGMAYGAFATVEEALGCIKEKILEKQEAAKKIEAATEKFATVVENNSLDVRYKDVNPEKKVLSNEELREKHTPYKNFDKNLAAWRESRTKLAAKIAAKNDEFETYK